MLCSNAKAGARLTLNTDRLSTGTTLIECDHGKLETDNGATLGFKSMKTAYATIKGIEGDACTTQRRGLSIFIMVIPTGEMRPR
ncbi:hypothetical protein [Escherichia coli]|uniref:hypothetical protein n=1 Tax=Escherichia coli TaxID=562 RepID=UPI003EC0293D